MLWYCDTVNEYRVHLVSCNPKRYIMRTMILTISGVEQPDDKARETMEQVNALANTELQIEIHLSEEDHISLKQLLDQVGAFPQIRDAS